MDKERFDKISEMVNDCNDGWYNPFGNFDETCRILLDLFNEVKQHKKMGEMPLWPEIHFLKESKESDIKIEREQITRIEPGDIVNIFFR